MLREITIQQPLKSMSTVKMEVIQRFVNGDLTVSNGKIDNAAGLVWIAGNTSYTSSTNGGYVSTGQLVFNGGLSQTINGDVINANRVEVDNSNGVTIQSGTLNIDSSLLLSSGVFTQGASASVVLQSDAEFDAYLDDLKQWILCRANY